MAVSDGKVEASFGRALGVGNRGGQNVGAFLKKLDRVDIVALCDVDSSHLAEQLKRVEGLTKKAPAGYGDYRKRLDCQDIDPVVVSTPDHWHALATIAACRAGKDVCCEKPLTLTIAEGQAMIAAARTNSRIVQTGSQQRSDDKFRRACEVPPKRRSRILAELLRSARMIALNWRTTTQRIHNIQQPWSASTF